MLAEETSSGRTVRSVDSSLRADPGEVSGFTTESRYAVACNGRKVPLHPTGEPERRSQAYGIAPDSCRRRYIPQFPCTRPLSSTLSTCGRNVRSADAPTMWDHLMVGIYTARPVNASGGRRPAPARFQESSHTWSRWRRRRKRPNPDLSYDSRPADAATARKGHIEKTGLVP